MLYLDDSLLYCVWKGMNVGKNAGRVLPNLEDIKKLKRDESSLPEAYSYMEGVGLKSPNNGIENLSLADKKMFESVLDHLIGFDMKSYEDLNSLPLKDEKGLKKFIDKYIDNFIQDSLLKGRRNYYDFSEQKKQIFLELVFNQEKYGKSFIFEYPEKYGVQFGIETNTDFLFIHSLIALETLGYLEIEDMWIYDAELPAKEQSINYKVKLKLKDKYFEERKKVTSMRTEEDEKEEIKFDADTSVLLFRNEETIISRTRNKAGHFLLETLFKDKAKIWELEEIAEDWGEDYAKDDWRKYYNAGRSVNEKVAKKTTIADFLIITNKTICINKKYL